MRCLFYAKTNGKNIDSGKAVGESVALTDNTRPSRSRLAYKIAKIAGVWVITS